MEFKMQRKPTDELTRFSGIFYEVKNGNIL